ncbi:DDE-type integrase/transposase/recombinase [Actimicrobium sp. CCC2.4]|uniref:DDE-type integrase/transposase/recombinase n=1 Tax=Actimicrobium sp. CCC2.4 TaxID=3048606 RepID=UPI002AC8C491|nr:DDE-type integrase/transposase/recombinase [Actimicrobium sp. CCC2.4]MEB0136851.1 DDE-type integrase/transposase/recombinase [Actimicrobium sp. CCC2.4]WPX34143.1 DDE-type integrase/transposase/recombinase [Actimicrobium sp. CCC2.4]
MPLTQNPAHPRQLKNFNNIVEQDRRVTMRVTKPMRNVKSVRSSQNTLAGIELMHMIRKGQMILAHRIQMTFAKQFYVSVSPPSWKVLSPLTNIPNF